jgi:hypothetical protein
MPILGPILGLTCRLTLSWINAKPEIGCLTRRDFYPARALVLNPTVVPTPHWFESSNYQTEIIPMGCDEPGPVMRSCQNTVYLWKGVGALNKRLDQC